MKKELRQSIFLLLLTAILGLACNCPAQETATSADKDKTEKSSATEETINEDKSSEKNNSVSWEGKTVIIPVTGVIGPESFGGAEEKIIAAINNASGKARLIVMEINSPGGVVDSCDKICEAILHSKTPVYALVIRKAISGGAMVATACKEIYMIKGSRMGDIQPMMMIPGAKIDERTGEKIEADVRAIMASNASHNGYSKVLLEAMVTRSFQIYEVKFTDGKREFLKQEQYDLLKKNMEQGIDKRTFAQPPRIVVTSGKLLSLEAQDAHYYGLAKKVVEDKEHFLKDLAINESDIINVAIAEGKFDAMRILKFDKIGLSNWLIMLLVICLLAGIAGTLTELSIPGFGLPGAIGIIGFSSFFYILMMHNRATFFEIGLFVVGIAFLIIEIVVLPGFGFAGITGIICLVAGLALSMLPDLQSSYMQEHFWDETISVLGVTFAFILIGLIVLMYILEKGDKIPLLKALFLPEKLPAGREALKEGISEDEQDRRENPDVRTKYLNECGVTATMLRPSGKVKLDSGEIIDVVSEGKIIDVGERVKVISTSMNHILVRRISE